ncbi:S-methyl-5-thioribose kinase [Vagococcus fluvialis]|uniref:S-methyl-5-thioribose kinase n=1 Tax=Vagococcus fluvialis TaxID=2738 RepID=UPI001A902DE7|nr:S-methyl-5-thioribose kinase [Vagococcus fluvialis]MBO0442207.1 S-methyl-5-thioribose kinase [Vagococcus fluvialis]MBO0478840.1 S-methyl-5-thioribose kinase [Vagococcus fluvialis]MBO0484201.1 S-methyl-5-thioribose kinase [Vagococcus fluvialis]MDT2746954.1 S-methyl-5-thioribose kinase [Vagococcus fluvialis]UDM71283.1 S-methyl-5-thioribose kinase [Vagococcus fluvialis]
MGRFRTHFLMNHEEVKEYVLEQVDLFDEKVNLSVTEIGDGNINYVFLVKDLESGKSVVLKQADKVLRSSGRALDIERNKIEAEALILQYSLVPKYVPEIYAYDEIMAVLIMEDISAFKNLRYELENQLIFPKFADDISTFLVQTLLSTTDLILKPQIKKERVQQFINSDMCDISEDLVFTEPYNDYKNRNIISKENQKFVEKYLYQNEVLIGEVGKLRNNYMNNAQSLLHGDLHSGSIFINQEGMKVIDPEFAFYGPMGYDIGNVIGNLFFPLIKKEMYEGSSQFTQWLRETISQIIDLVKEKLIREFNKQVTLDIYLNSYFIENYINEIISDTLGYAGTEIIRRTIGDARVREVATAPVGEKRVQMERNLLLLGSELILKRHEIKSGAKLLNLYDLIKE